MRLRIRDPNGQSTVTLSEDATVSDLQTRITESTSIASFDLKYGYPPQTLSLQDHPPSKKLSELNIKLNGEQLIVSDKSPPEEKKPTQDNDTILAPMPLRKQQAAPLSLNRKAPSADAPEIPFPSHASTMVLRIMQDDNSCMFRAFNSAYFGAMDNMHELRSVIAQTIQANPDKYSAVVLERNPDDYCKWIQSEDAWGGFIELDILSRHFDIEISSIDVQTLRVDKFNEGKPKRCILVYSGIHYDVIALSPSEPPLFDKAYAPPDFDVKVFDSFDEEVLQKAGDLCQVLQQQHYYTDTASFQVRCNVCGSVFKGERGATEHASQTGHYDFGESS
ncbi:MAG: ubiquitin-specific protease otu1 [Stictis urceolatum]|nr:ubiquitin-specific protease otu1 [Stictis urceolata]